MTDRSIMATAYLAKPARCDAPPGPVWRWLTTPKYWPFTVLGVTADALIAIDDPREPDVRALLERHVRFARGQSPPERSFALDLRGLLDPAITMFSIRAHGNLLGIGAIKRLDRHHAEIKSMHTAEAARGRGVGRTMLTYLLGVARAQGFSQVSLETGTAAGFAPARALYHSLGFVPCAPFADYTPSEDNLFMTLKLRAEAGIRG
jgi:putative acetyltransferase